MEMMDTNKRKDGRSHSGSSRVGTPLAYAVGMSEGVDDCFDFWTFTFFGFFAFLGFAILSTCTESICVQRISVDQLYVADTMISCTPGAKLLDRGFFEVMISPSSYSQVYTTPFSAPESERLSEQVRVVVRQI
jgi:hypothetical protein